MKAKLIIYSAIFWLVSSFGVTLDQCMAAKDHNDPNAMELCQQALESDGVSVDDQSKIFITQAALLIRQYRLQEANDILDTAFNHNPKMLENGRYRYNWLRTKGRLYFVQEAYANALPFYEQALDVAQIMGDSRVIAMTYNDLGAIHQDMNQYQKSLEWLQKSLEINHQLGDHSNAAYSLANMAEVYIRLGDKDKALEYYHLSLKSHQQSLMDGEKADSYYAMATAQVHQSLGSLHISLNDFEQARTHLNQAFETYQDLGLKSKEVVVLSSMGKMFLQQENTDLALQYLEQAHQIELTLESQDNLNLKANRVDAFISANQWEQAEKVALLGLQQAKIKNTLDRQVVFLKQLATIHQQSYRLDSAIEYLKQAHTIEDQLREAKYDQAKGQLLAEIELHQKQQELLKLEGQKTMIEVNNKQQRMLFIGIGLLLLTSIIYLMFLLKRKGQIKSTIQTDQTIHNNQLEQLKISKESISSLFNEVDTPFICFDSTGQIYQVSATLSDDRVDLQMQKDFPEIWQLIEPHLTEDEKLETDLNSAYQSDHSDSIWVHQLAFMDNILVCLLIQANEPGSLALNHAAQIKKYSEFMHQMDLFMDQSTTISIKQANQLNTITEGLKQINQGSLTTKNRFSQDEFKKSLVELMMICVETWQQTTAKSAVDLAQESRLWLVSIEDGHLRTRTMDRYTDIKKIPDHPRWRQVIKTAHYVLSHCQLSVAERQALNLKTDQVKQMVRNRAMGH